MARKTISQRIALDGGEQIRKVLQALGEQGEKAFRDIQAAAEKLRGPGAEFARNMDRVRKQIKAVGEQMNATGRKIRNVGKDLTIGVTTPIVGIGAGVLKVASDFEAAMNRVRAALGATGDEFIALSDRAKELGRTTQFSASEAAGAIEVLAKNGLDAAQILGGALDASLTLAAASGSDLGASADAATDVMLSFGLEARDLAAIVDGMTGTMLASKFGFEDYAQALGQAGGVAGGLGVGFGEFNAVLAATGNLFSSGSDAGTSFKTFLTRLKPQSKEAAELMKTLGLEFFTAAALGGRFRNVGGEAAGTMKTMAAVAEELRQGLSRLSEEDRTAALTTLFGTDAMRTAIGLMQAGGDGIETLDKRIGEASAAEQAKARMEGFAGSMKALTSALEGLAIAIADSGLLRFVTDLVKR